MGKRGPKTLSIEEHKTRGTYRADRHAGPEIPAEEPSCPTWLNREASACWKRNISILVDRVGLAKVDREALAVYCQTWAEYHEMEKYLAKHGRTYETITQTGSTIHRARPEVAIRDRARSEMLKYAAQLGLTPSARTGMHIDNKAKKTGIVQRMA